MTTLIAIRQKDSVILAADSRITAGSFVAQEKAEKIFKANGIWYAVSGHSRVSDLIRYTFAPPERHEGEGLTPYVARLCNALQSLLDDNKVIDTVDAMTYAHFTAFVVVDCVPFEITSDFGFNEITRHAALGSGCEFAWGAMEACYTYGIRINPQDIISIVSNFDTNTDDRALTVTIIPENGK